MTATEGGNAKKLSGTILAQTFYLLDTGNHIVVIRYPQSNRDLWIPDNPRRISGMTETG